MWVGVFDGFVEARACCSAASSYFKDDNSINTQ